MLSISRCSRHSKLNRVFSLKLAKSLSILNPVPSPESPASQTLTYLKSLNSRISSYMRNGLVFEAQNLFDKMPHKNTVTWNALIRGYFRNGQSQKALNLFHVMPERDIYTYNTVISGLVRCGDLDSARKVFDAMLVRDVVSWNSVLVGYVHEGLVDETLRLFSEMPSEMRDVISWNLAIGALLNSQQVDLAKEYFEQMSVRDFVSWTIMISGFAKVGRIAEACEFFEEMPVKHARAWTALMVGYMQNGLVNMAKDLFHRMPERDLDCWKYFIGGLVSCGRVVDAIRFFMQMPQKCIKTWDSVLLELIRNGHVKEAHAFLEKLPYGDVISWTNLLVAYFEIGEVNACFRLFELMLAPDTTVWNVMICGLGENDHGEEGLNFFVRMKILGSSPNESTFTSVLTICSDLPSPHLGEQIQAEAIKTGFDQPTDEHYTCLIDLLGRFGLIDEAMAFINQMTEDGTEVPASVWGALLGACRIHKNIEVGVIAGERLLEIEPDRSAVYLIFAEMYLTAGRNKDAKQILDRRIEKGVKKQPGCSWIEINNNGHVFLSGDKSHLEFIKICSLLDLLRKDMEIMFAQINTTCFEQ